MAVWPEDSLTAFARAAAVGVGQAIVTLVAPPKGYYKVRVIAQLDGAAVAIDRNNLEVREGANVKARVLVNVGDGGSGSASAAPLEMYLRLDGATDVSVNANGAGTAAVGYNVSLVATRIND